MKKWCIRVGLLIVFGWVVFELFLNPWSKINCWEREVDINTGLERYTRYYAYIPCEREVTETWVSESLGIENTKQDHQWKKVVTLSPGVGNSPHYIFHSALHDIHRFESVIKHVDASESVMNAIAQNVVFLWKGDNSDWEAGRYLQDIESSIYEDLGKGGKVTLELVDVPDLGMWLERSLNEYKANNENEFVIGRFESMIENYGRTRRSTQHR